MADPVQVEHDPSQTILVLHSPHLDPLPFLTRLVNPSTPSSAVASTSTPVATAISTSATSTTSGPTSTSASTSTSPSKSTSIPASTSASARVASELRRGESHRVPWTIDNKYYTAQVEFRTAAIGAYSDPDSLSGVTSWDEGDRARGVPVVLYLFTGDVPSPLPRQLTRMVVHEPRDIALAVHVANPESEISPETGSADEDVKPETSPETGNTDEDVKPEASQETGGADEEAKPESSAEIAAADEPKTQPPLETSSAEEAKSEPPLPTGSSGEGDQAGEEGKMGKGEAGAVFNMERAEEAFDELGMEVVDETAAPEDDDERPIPPLEQIRQTLYTHMWPRMTRKAFSASVDVSLDTENDYNGETNDDDGAFSAFPTSFTPAQTGNGSGMSDFNERAETDAGPSSARATSSSPHLIMAFPDLGPTSFPALEDMREQLALDEQEEIELDVAEYARLDDWLDADGEDADFELLDGEDGLFDGEHGFQGHMDGADFDHVEAGSAGDGHRHTESGLTETAEIVIIEQAETPGFEDDFDDFAPFHTAPPVTRRAATSGMASGLLTMDPTPLLLHLQSVRAELAGMEDEDERRVRAAREVGRMMRDLGMWEDEDLGELELFDDEFGDVAQTATGTGRRGEVVDLII